MTNEEVDNLIVKYYSDKNFKVDEISRLRFFDRLRYNRLFPSVHIYKDIGIWGQNQNFSDKVFYREVNLVDMDGKEVTKYIDITVINESNIEIDEFDSFEI
jgi:hypothetical protein